VIGRRTRVLVAGIAVASTRCMAFAYSDETIRVPKLHIGPTRSLPTHYAPPRPRRLPYLLLVALLAFAAATPIQLPQPSDRTVQAQKLLELIRS
jgi:hypothetical protein